MSESGLKIFKLNYNGTFDEVSHENIKDVFTIVNIIAIYVQKKKIMYVWIGQNATQALKNHISNIRVSLKEEFPQFRILRNITFEMRSEPYDFFNNLDISKEELYEHIDYQEKLMLPTIRKIDELKVNSENLIESQDYENAVKISEEIIELAEKFNDEALLIEQKRLMQELRAKSENKKIIEDIEQKMLEVENEFSILIEAKEFLKAHRIIEEFKKKFANFYDLSLIPSAKELISKEKKIWKEEQDRIIKELNQLENILNFSLNVMDLENAGNAIEKSKMLLIELVDDEIKKNWDEFKKKFVAARNLIESVEKLSINGLNALERKAFNGSLNFYDQIINQIQEYQIRK